MPFPTLMTFDALSPATEQRRRRLAFGRWRPVVRSALAAAGLLLILTSPAFSADRIQPRNVLILLTGRYGLPAYDTILHEIRTALNAGISGPLNLYAEYMEIIRFPSPGYRRSLVELYKGKYAALKIDLLIAIGPNLAPIFETLSDEFLSEVSTIIIELAKRDADLHTAFQKANITGVFPAVNMRKAIDTAFAIHPGTKHLFLVSGASPFDLSLLDQAKRAGRRYQDRILVEDSSRMPMEEILSAVGTLPDESVVLFTTFQRDAAGVPFYTREATRMAAARSRVPLFVLFDTNLGVGALGGYVISFKQVGIEAAKIALRILRGEKPASIPPVRAGLHQNQFDFRQLERWKIAQDRLPGGSILLHRDVSVLKEHFSAIMGILIFMVLQSGMIAYLVVLYRRQGAMSAKIRHSEGRYRELLRIERSTRLGEMAASLAHELNQPLAAILSSAQAALRFLKGGRLEPRLLREILQRIVEDDKRAASIISGLRRFLKNDRIEKAPVAINDILIEAMVIFRGEASAREVRVEHDLCEALPPVMADKNQLLQILLNLMLNAAQAMETNRPDDRELLLQSRAAGSHVEVIVRDGGLGIDPDQIDRLFEPFFTTKPHGMGMGLGVCRAIVKDHEGRIRAENNPDRGAAFVLELPVVNNG